MPSIITIRSIFFILLLSSLKQFHVGRATFRETKRSKIEEFYSKAHLKKPYQLMEREEYQPFFMFSCNHAHS